MKIYEANIKKITEVMLSNPRYLTLDFIAQSVGLSKRSVQNYLADIDDWIKKNALSRTRIIRKQGSGVMLDADAMDRLKIEKLLCGKSLSIHSGDDDRRLDIIKKLIVLEEDVTVKSLAEQFYVSRPTVASDLEWVGEWLAAYKIELLITQRKGIVTRGGEVSYRNAIVGYFDSCGSVQSGETIILKNRNGIHEKNFHNLTEIYPEDTVEKVRKIIESAEKSFGFFLTEDYYTSLLTHIVISISRVINGNTVPPEFVPPDDEEFPAFVMKTAGYIAGRLETVFNIKVPEMEKTYICIHLVGFNALSDEQSANAEIPNKIKHLALELIKSVDSQTGTRFISDKLLFFGLCMHLNSKVFRLRKNVYYRKTSDLRLPDNGVDIYNAVGNASKLYHEICGVSPDEDETLNITCYFLLSLHRNTRKPRALLICNDGIAERMRFMDFIKNTLPSVEVADCCTTYQLKLLAINEYDFVISTEAVESLEKPVADLSAVDKNNCAGFILDFVGKMNLRRA